MSGTIFSVNDISGIPSIEVIDTGAVKIAETFGSVAIGANTLINHKLYVNGNTLFTNATFNNGATLTNKSRLSFKTLNGNTVFMEQQDDDNFVLYTTTPTGASRPVFAVYANTNTSNLNIVIPLQLSDKLVANGSTGSAGQVLTSSGSGVYWGAAGSGGGSYTFSTGLTNTSNTITVNAAYIATITSNNASFANSASFVYGKQESQLSVAAATTANNSTYLDGRTWATPFAIGSTVANTGAFTTLTASANVNLDSGTLFVDATTNRVGIGITTPNTQFHISSVGANGTTLMIEHPDANKYPAIVFNSFGGAAGDLSCIVADTRRTTGDFGSALHGLIYRSGRSTLGNHSFLNSANTVQMVITEAGNVGIGTTSPAGELDVSSSGEPDIYLSRRGLANNHGASGVGQIYFRDANNAYNTASIQSVGYMPGNNGVLTFKTTNAGTLTERMRINEDGNVGIGSTSAPTKLFVNGHMSVANGFGIYANGVLGANGLVLTSNGTSLYWGSVSASGGGGFTGNTVSANSTIVKNQSYAVNATAGWVTMSLPSTVATGDIFIVHTYGGNTRILNNSINIMDIGTGNDLVLENGETVWLQAVNATSVDILFTYPAGGTPTMVANAVFATTANNSLFAYGKQESQLSVASAVTVSGTVATSNNASFLNGRIWETAGAIGSTVANTGAFTTLTASANVNFDSGTLFVNGPSNRVGIGTTTPATSLDITGVQSLRGYGSATGINMYSYRGTAVSPTIVQAGDTLGAMAFYGWDGDQDTLGSFIISTVEAGVGNNVMPSDLQFWTNQGSTLPSQRMTIAGSGNVGIGNTVPGQRLQVDGSVGIKNALIANGVIGANGTVLTSNGSTIYWGTVSAGGGTTTNAVTFNNGGTGDASGTTFNGSAARTISYNTVGAPSTTGTGASGSWSILAANATFSTTANNSLRFNGKQESQLSVANAVFATTANNSLRFNGKQESQLSVANAVFADTANNALRFNGKQEAQLSVASAAQLTTTRAIGDVNFNGTAAIVPERILYKDTRATNYNPATYPGVTVHLKTNGTDGLTDGGSFHGVLNVMQWSDTTGGNDHQLAFTDNNNMWLRQSTNSTAWGAWAQVLTSTVTNQNLRVNSLGVGTAASGTAGEIRATDNITAYYSDERLKNIEGTIPNPIEKIKQLSGVYYRANEIAASYGYTNDKKQIGVIAQEVEAVLPEIVVAAPFDIGQDDDGNEYSISGENYKTVQYEKMVPLLIEAIKDQQSQIDELKQLVKTLINKEDNNA